MTREEAKDLFRTDLNSYGCPKKIMSKIDMIFDSFEKSSYQKKQIALLDKYLEDYTDDLGNAGCNDVDEEVWKDWTKEERIQFTKEFYEYNGDPENFDEDDLYLADFCIVGLLKHKIKNNLL
jgi:hypothetical protein